MNHVQTQPCHTHPPPATSHLRHHHHPQQQPDCLLPSSSSQPVVLIGSDAVVSTAPPATNSLCDARLSKDSASAKAIQQPQQPQIIYTVYSTSPTSSHTTSTPADVSSALDRFPRQHYPPQPPTSSSQSCSLLLPNHHGPARFSVKPECTASRSPSSPSGSSTPLHVITSAAGGGACLLSSDAVQFNKCELLTDDDDDDDDEEEEEEDEEEEENDDDQEDHQLLDDAEVRRRMLSTTSSAATRQQQVHYQRQPTAESMVATDLRTTPASSSSAGQLPDPCSQQLSIDYANSSRLNSNPVTVSASTQSPSGGTHLSGVPLVSHRGQYAHPQSARQPGHNSFSASSMISPGSHHELAGSSGPPSSQGMVAEFDLVDQLLPSLTHQPHHHLHQQQQQQQQLAFSGISSANCGVSLLPMTNNSDHVFSRDHLHPTTLLSSSMEGAAKSRRYSLPYELLIGGGGSGSGDATSTAPGANGNHKLPLGPGNLELLERCGAQISPAPSSVLTKSSLSKLSDPNGLTDDSDQRAMQPLDFVTYHHHGNEAGVLMNGASRCFSNPTVAPLGMTAGRGGGAGDLLHLQHHPVFDPQCHGEVELPGFNSPESAFYQYQNRMEGQRCQVCGELAAGFHHGAYVCEACKKFFMRHSLTDTKPTNVCPTGGNCVVAKGSRGKCQICRYRKCLLVGMRMKDPETQPDVDISNIPCRVCGGRSSGFHFGALTCEGCKGFFRRTEGSASSLVCVGGQNACTITPRSRNACKSCRFRRCLSAGMSKKGSRIGRQPNAVKFHCAIEIRQLQHVRSGKPPPHPLSSGDSHTTPGSSNSTPYLHTTTATYPGSDLLGASRPASLQNRAPATSTGGGTLADEEGEDIDDRSPRYTPEHHRKQSLFPVGFSQQQQQHDSLAWLLPPSAAQGDQKPPVTASLFLLLPPPPSGCPVSSMAVDMGTSGGATPSTAAGQLVSPAGGMLLHRLTTSTTTKDEPMTPGRPIQPDYPITSISDDNNHNTSIADEASADEFEEPQQMVLSECPPHAVISHPASGTTFTSSSSPSSPPSISTPSLLAPFGYYYRHYYQQQQQQQQLIDWRHSGTTSTVHHHQQQQEQHQVALTASLVASLARKLASDADHSEVVVDEDMRQLSASPPPNQEAVLRFSDGMRTATEFLRLPNTYFRTRFRMTSIPLDREESSCRIWGHMMNHFHMHAQQIVQFAKLVPGFNQLGITARSSLVRGGMYPVVLLLLSRDYRPESDEYNYFDFTSGERAVIMRHFPTFIRFTEHLRMAGLLLHHLGLNLPELSLASAVEVLRNYHILEEPTRASTKELFILAYHTLKTCIARRTTVTSSAGGVGDQHRWDQFLALSKMIQAMNREHHQILADLKESRPDLHFPELYIEMFQLADSASALFASAAAAAASCASTSSSSVVTGLACSTAVAALKLGTGTESCAGQPSVATRPPTSPGYSPLNGDAYRQVREAPRSSSAYSPTGPAP